MISEQPIYEIKSCHLRTSIICRALYLPHSGGGEAWGGGLVLHMKNKIPDRQNPHKVTVVRVLPLEGLGHFKKGRINSQMIKKKKRKDLK